MVRLGGMGWQALAVNYGCVLAGAVSFVLTDGTAKAKAANSKPDVVKRLRTKAGLIYADQVVTISVNDGKMTVLNVVLEKS